MIRIGTRGSPLALIQTQMVADQLKAQNYEIELSIIKTTGDINTQTPLTEIGGKMLFAKEIQQALLKDDIHLGVHSLKDLEADHPEGLTLLGTLQREDTHDILLFKKDIDPYKDAFTLGTCSPRRSFFSCQLFPNVHIVPLRGNVQTRIGKIEKEEIDATVLAVAGLKRLGIFHDICQKYNYVILNQKDFPPASCQGIIGIEGKAENKHVVDNINHTDTYLMAQIERNIIKKFNGNCHSAIGILTTFDQDCAHILVKYQDPKTNKMQEIEYSDNIYNLLT